MKKHLHTLLFFMVLLMPQVMHAQIYCPAPRTIIVNNTADYEVTISWTRGGTETAWEFTIVGDSTYYLTDTFFTARNLESYTNYDVIIRAICGYGDTSLASTASFQTPCYPIIALPYFNDFENEPHHQPRITSYAEAFPRCWTRINDSPTSVNYYPYITNSSSYIIHGSKSLYWYHNYDNNYADNEYAVLPPVNQSLYDSLISNLSISFYAKTTTQDPPYPLFIVGAMVNVTDPSTFVPVDTITLTNTTTLYTVSLASYTGTGKYVVIRSPRTSSTRHASLDDIYMNRTDQWCNPVSNLMASAINTEVTLMWNANGSSSFTVILGTDTVTGVTDTFYTFYNLSDTTVYNYAVAAECYGSRSRYMFGSIRTECRTLTYDDLPYTEDFERYGCGRDSNISLCWQKGVTGTFLTHMPPYPERCLNDNDTVGLRFGASTRYTNWASLPTLDDSMDVSGLEVTFLVKRPNTVPILSQLVVGVATHIYSDSVGNSQFSGFVPVDTIDLSSEPPYSLHSASVRFDNYTGNGRHILFLAPSPSDSISPTTSNGFYLDNVTLRIASACPTPQNVRVTRTTADSVYATWNHVNNTNFSLVYVGTPGFSTDTASLLYYVYNDSAAIGDLSPDTEYELVVVANCGGESYPSYPARFHTLCAPITTLPFVEGFERASGVAGTYSYSNNLPQCWLYWNTGTDFSYMGYPIVHSDPSYAHSGNNAMRFCNIDQPSYSDQIAILPLTDSAQFPISNLQVSFWTRSYHYYFNSYIEVGVMSDPRDTSTFVPVRTVYTYNPQVISSNYYSHHTVGFANYSGPHGHVAFKAPIPASGSNIPYIDDIILDEIPNSCPDITAIHSQTTASAALLTWDYNIEFGSPVGFNVTYRYAGDSTATPISTFTSEPEILLTDLGSDSLYWVSVEADCGGLIGTACTAYFNTQGLPCAELDTIGTPVDTIILGNPGTAANQLVPLSGGNPYSYCQQLFLASEIPTNGPTSISGIAFDYYHSQFQPMTNSTNCSIYLAHTNRPHMFVGDTSFVPYSQLQLVYVGPLNCPSNGWNYFQFNQGHFHYDGHSNLCLAVVDNSGTTNNSLYCFRYEQVVNDENEEIPVMLRSVSWGNTAAPYTPVEMDARPTSYSWANFRTNTRLITGGAGDCLGLATCLPPAVSIDTTTDGYCRISWIPGYHETSWDVDYRIADSNNWTSVANDTTATRCFVPASNLQPDTRYEFRVTSNCSDTNVSASAFAVTPCSYIRIPFSYGFEGLTTGDNTTPPDFHCWHHLNNGAIYNGTPYIISTWTHSGSRSLYWGVSLANNHGTHLAVALPPVDVSVNPVNTLYLSFWARTGGTYYSPVLYVGVMTDPDNIATFQAVDTVYVNNSTTDWDLYECHLAGYSGEGQYIALCADRSFGSWGAVIDDIRVSNAPLCHRVHDIKVRNVTTDSATISWTRGGTETAWELKVGDNTYYPTDTFYNVHNLVSNTPYNVTVRAICSGGDTSIATSSFFHTPCYLLGTLPYSNNFENEPFYSYTVGLGTTYPNAFPVCWMRIPSNLYYPYVINANTYLIHGNNCLYWNSQNGDRYPDNAYAVLPPVDLSLYDIHDLTLSFYAKTTTIEDPYPMLVVGVMAHSTDTASFVPVDTIVPTNTITLYTVSFANYNGTYNYIAIRCPPTSTSRHVSLDDIYLTDQICNPPSNLRSSSTDSSVTMWWNADGNSSFTVSLGSNTATGITDTFYTFYGLTSSTVYHYAVATECSGVTSIFLTGTIQTECPPLTYDDLPYNEDFESYGYGYGVTDISPCWHKGEIRDVGYNTDRPNPGNCLVNNDTVGLSFGSSQYMSCWAALPRLDDSVDVSGLEVTFLVKRPNTASVLSQLVVGVASEIYTDSASNLQFSGFVPVDTIDLSDEHVNSLHDASVRFNNYSGNGRYILFLAPSPSDSISPVTSNGFYLDNITLKIANPCPTPEHVIVTRTTADSVYATWDPMPDVDTFLVYVGTPRFNIAYSTPHYVYSNSAAIGGLRSDSEYELIVVASCSGSLTSDASFPIRFHTLCAPITTLPFVEDFEGVTGLSYPLSNVNNLPPCWLYWNMGTNYSHAGFPIVHSDAAYAHGGTNAMCFMTGNAPGDYTDQIAIMPLTDATLFPVSGLQVSFWIRSYHYYYNDSYLEVGVMSDPRDTSTFVPVGTVYTYNSQVISSVYYSHHTVSFANYTGPHGHVAFKAPSHITSNQPYIDDITLEPHPCSTAEDFHLVYAAADSLIIAWSDPQPEPVSWFVEYDTADFIPGSGTQTPIHVTDTFYIMAGLDSGTTYHVYLYHDCLNPDTFYYLAATTPAACTPPQNITGAISADSLCLTWTPGGTETLWEVTLLDGADSILNSLLSIFNSFTFRGLTGDSIYTVRIRAICNPEDTSLAVFTSFDAPRYTVTVTADNPAYGSVSGDGIYFYGDTAILTATPYSGYGFSEWSDGIIENPRNLLVTSDTIIIAQFQRIHDTTGIDNEFPIPNSQFSFFPNPATAAITVSLTGFSGKVRIAVFDLLGREMTSEIIECSSTDAGSDTGCRKQIDIKGLPAGTYMLRVTSGNNVPMVRKLIVR